MAHPVPLRGSRWLVSRARDVRRNLHMAVSFDQIVPWGCVIQTNFAPHSPLLWIAVGIRTLLERSWGRCRVLWLEKQESQLNGSTESGSGQGQYLSWKKLRQIWPNKNLRDSRLVPSVAFGQQSYCAISFSSAQFWFMGSDGWPRHIETSLFLP